MKNRDFKSNDPVQVRLKHEFRRRGWFYTIKRGANLSDETRKNKSAKQTYFNGEISNEDVAKCIVAIKEPEVALQKGSEAFFGEMYNGIFTTDISTNRCLVPVLLLRLIRDTYRGTKKFHTFKARVFKGRAAYHVISLIYGALKSEKDWEKKFAYFWESGNGAEYDSFYRSIKRPINDLFEIYYDAWHKENKKSKIEYDTFLERSTTLNEIIKKNKSRMHKDFVAILEGLQRHVLIEPQKETQVTILSSLVR